MAHVHSTTTHDGIVVVRLERPERRNALIPEMAQALETALSLSAPRRAELARAAQDHVRTRYALAESNSKLVEIYQRLSEKTS